jgi:hypothetical protein
MFKKTKEKINSNEYVILFKKMWDNKRYRSILILVIYFIFFGIIIGVTRENYKNTEINDSGDSSKQPTIIEKKNNWNNYEKNYQYIITLNDEKIADVKVDDGIINLNVNNKDYIVINNVIYQNKNDDLKKVKEIPNLKISLPITKLNIREIMNYLKDLEASNYTENAIKYQISSSYFIDNTEENIDVEVYGYDNLEKIVINYQEEKITLEMSETDVGSVG